ncbi:MAG: Holliday junction resolvase RuvX [Desulfovibrionaceae bacterium]
MKFLAIDYGLARTGIAVTDAGGRMAFPRCTLCVPAGSPRALFLAQLVACISREQPAALVVGLPVMENGEDSLTTRQVRNFVERLKRRVDLPVYFMPEFLSSYAAEGDLHRAGVYGAHKKAVLDQQAAVCILESFLAEPEARWRLA